METIEWTDDFSVGIEEMDKQHKKLIDMINRLIVEQKEITDAETIAELLSDMTDYAEDHFRAEEYLMAEYGYELKDLQQKQHEAFITTTEEFYGASGIGENILSRALLDYLRSWLMRHILIEDMKYKDFFRAKGVC